MRRNGISTIKKKDGTMKVMSNGTKLVEHTKRGVSQKAGTVFVDNNPDWQINQKKGEAFAETVAVAMKDVSDRNTNKILKNVKISCKAGNE